MERNCRLYAGWKTTPSRRMNGLGIINECGFSNVTIQKNKPIIIPDDILANYLSPEEIRPYKSGIVNITYRLRRKTGQRWTQLLHAGQWLPLTILHEKKKLLFVCVENSNRSGWARLLLPVRERQGSRSSVPAAGPGIINPKAIAAMEANWATIFSKHESKSLDEVKADAPFDVVVTMGCGDACPLDAG